MIEFHAVQTPNALKVAILLKELDLPNTQIMYNTFAGEHLATAFRALNPNNKLPVIRDLDPKDGGEPITVFESGAILIYLAEREQKFLGNDDRTRNAIIQWLMWQMSGLGPMCGQLGHFKLYAPDDQTYSLNRYTNEVERLFDVLEYHLEEAPFLAGAYSIADIAVWPVTSASRFMGVDFSKRPAITRWLETVNARSAVAEAAQAIMGDVSRMASNVSRAGKIELSSEQWSNLFGDNLRAAARPRGLLHKRDRQ